MSRKQENFPDIMTEKKYTFNRKDVVAQKENPWARDLAHTIKRGKKITGFAAARYSLANENTGEHHGEMAFVGMQKVVDKEEFVKFFGAGIIEVFDLAKGGKDLFKTILHAYLDAKNQADQIYINFASMRDDFDYQRSRATFSNALAELLQKGFLAPVQNKENLYWINPHLFYKGDRIRIVREYVRVGTPAHEDLKREQKALAHQKESPESPS
jgi:hypothetical protein